MDGNIVFEAEPFYNNGKLTIGQREFLKAIKTDIEKIRQRVPVNGEIGGKFSPSDFNGSLDRLWEKDYLSLYEKGFVE
ncbi:hypothetical protein LGQ02_12915 [Bacillus shivajii]|uniref:hypothetical protein n=1 Tax=Bacillus shivajii TaxID=1983719 RepID=UPI001CF98AEA|nr:hypothetical protein [Bacillus shivajii]UCZ51762.1 hypothetical protein LGQ02_12915 [Bacillus shivajii]